MKLLSRAFKLPFGVFKLPFRVLKLAFRVFELHFCLLKLLFRVLELSHCLQARATQYARPGHRMGLFELLYITGATAEPSEERRTLKNSKNQ